MFPYEPLGSVTSTRLIELLPPKHAKDRTIHARLRQCNLDNAPSYEAISYVWGTEKDTVPFYCNSHRLKITPNLASALRQFRPDLGTRLLWVDKICINQDDVRERNHQVALMGRVYSSASTVLIWLGEHWEGAAEAFAWIHEIAFTAGPKFEEFLDRLAPRNTQDKTSEFWQALQQIPIPHTHSTAYAVIANLFSHPWFHRAWTYQEYVLAKNVTFFCGPCNVKQTVWDIGLLCLYLLDQSAEELPLLSSRQLRALSSFSIFGTTRTATDRRKRDNLLDLLGRRRGAACKHPVDVVYSLLGMTKTEDLIVPDYSIPPGDVFLTLAVSQILKTRSLGIFRFISGKQIHGTGSSLPSWVPDWTVEGQEQLVWLPGKLAQSAFSKLDLNVSVSSDKRRLILKGVFFDQIQLVDIPWLLDDDDKTYVPMEGETFLNDMSGLLRSLKVFSPGDPTSMRATQMGQREILNASRQNWGDEIQFFRAKQWEMLGRFRICTTDYGRWGATCPNSQPGDIIACVLGHNPLIVLRATATPDRYLYVGECYLRQPLDEPLREARKKANPGVQYDRKDETWLQNLHEGAFPFDVQDIVLV